MGLQRHIVLSLVWLFLGACDSKETSRLEQALQLSGENRGELEKVLAHFSQSPADSLRLKAAIFLIENMPGHWGAVIPKKALRTFSAVTQVSCISMSWKWFFSDTRMSSNSELSWRALYELPFIFCYKLKNI